MRKKKTFTAEEIIKAYRIYKTSGLQIDFLVFLGVVEKEPLPETIEFMGGKYRLKS